MAPLFRYPDGPVPNLLALGYAVGGYLLGMGLILAPSLALNLAGTLLLAHAMVLVLPFVLPQRRCDRAGAALRQPAARLSPLPGAAPAQCRPQ